jgi:hypothetical protein
MRRSEPPSLATWILDHAVPGGRDEGLAGDLLEEYRSGRSAGWYWRQVFSATVIGFTRMLGGNGALILFAALWSLFAPAWLLIVTRAEEHYHLKERFYRMDWPWSTVCDLGLLLVANLAFVWAGIVLYLLPDLLHSQQRKVRPIGRGLAGSLRVLMVVWVALIAVPKYFISVQTTGQPVLGPVNSYAITHLDPADVVRVAPQDEWTARYGDPIVVPEVNPLSLITDVRQSTMIVRLPFFLVVLCALWRFRARPRIKRIDIRM